MERLQRSCFILVLAVLCESVLSLTNDQATIQDTTNTNTTTNTTFSESSTSVTPSETHPTISTSTEDWTERVSASTASSKDAEHTSETAPTELTRPPAQDSSWRLPPGMEWVLLGILVFLIFLALAIAICLVWSNRDPNSRVCFLVRKPDTLPGIEEEEEAIVNFPDLPSMSEEDPPKKPVHAVKPLKYPHTDGDASNRSDPCTTASSPDSARPKPLPRRAKAPDGMLLEEAAASAEDAVAERGTGDRTRKSLYTVFRQSLANLDAVQAYLVDRLELGQLADDFKAIPVSITTLSHEDADLPENKKKNRFASVVPYDKNRVVLKDGYTEGEATDYVNASFVNGYQTEKSYIASQGPKDTTASDFWRMIWQEKVAHIVMLTNIKERGRDKCHQYWPEERGDTVTWGPITLTLDTVEARATFLIRRFTLTSAQGSERRGVTQFHYITWPDFGVPLTASLVSFWRYVKRKREEEGAEELPLLVHCSAGVGRSGTFIGLDIAMQQSVGGGKVDLIELVTSLRHQRVLMVQAAAQFEFLHMALLEAYTSRDSIFPVDEISSVFTSPIQSLEPNARLDKEFKLLTEMNMLANDMDCQIAKRGGNRAKNRNSRRLPADDHIVFLREYVSGRGDYINAVYMPTFHESQGSVVTQLPLPSTLVDFWRLVYGEKISTIVSLGYPDEDVDPPCQFWPTGEGEVMEVAPYTIRVLSVSTVSASLLSYSLCLQKEKVTETREVVLLRYEGWTGETAGNVDDVMNVVDTLMTLSSSQTYLVQCTDGVQKSGLFCALCDVIGRMMYDDEVDVYMSVRHIQSVSPYAVSSVIQYRYLYAAALRRSSQMSLYANEI